MSTRVGRVIASCLLTVALAVPFVSGHASADDGDLGSRLKTACLRIPPIREQMNLRIVHLEGAADLDGSLAWFQAQIDRATATDHPVLAAKIQHRFDFLTTRLALIKARVVVLERVAERCRSKGIEV